MALIKCPECGKEISDKAKACIHCGYEFEVKEELMVCEECGKKIAADSIECPHCGFPVEKREEKPIVSNSIIKSPKNIKKIVSAVAVLVVVLIVGMVVYNVKVVKPQKIEEQNKATYEEAIELLEKGKYEEGNELLQTIVGYKDVDTILEQVKWESYVYECINDWKQWLKNPDSFTLYEVAFYLDEESHGMYASLMGEVDFSYPAIIFRSGAQNGFGGNTTGYELFYYIKDSGYTCMGSCDYLDEDEYYDDDGDLKDEDNGAMEVLLCKEINSLKEEAEQVGTVDMDRIKVVLKNDAYSTIKIIE